MNTLRAPVWLLALSLVVLLPMAKAADTGAPAKAVWVLSLDGVVGPATADYLVRGIEHAAQADASAVLLTINTPGGLDTSMRKMIAAVLASPIPVICYVSPGGARAASAGTYLLYACHVAAMAPATNLGAATPVAIGTPLTPSPGGGSDGKDQGKSGGSVMEHKILNDAIAYIRSLAELRGRNADWAEQAVREGASLSAKQALKLGVIDLIAVDQTDLLHQLKGRTLTIKQHSVALDNLADAPRVTLTPDWRSQFLAVITNPNVAYMLMLFGIYGLIFEFSHPGIGVPGVLGAISLLLALYAFQILPVSYAGLALMLLGIGMMVAEMFLPSFGILGVGGVIAFIVGSIILMDTELPAYRIAMPIIVGLAVSTGAMIFMVVGMAIRAHRRPHAVGLDSVSGMTLEVEKGYQDQPLVRYQSELWPIRCSKPLQVGDRVRVLRTEGITLFVDKVED